VTTGSGRGLERLDPVSRKRDAVFDSQGERLALLDFAISPQATSVALLWSDRVQRRTQLSVLRAVELRQVPASDRVLSSMKQAEGYFGSAGLAWSPDGASLAFTTARLRQGSSGSSVVVVDVATGDTREIAQSDQFYSRPRWSPDGDFLYVTRYPCTACGPGTSAVDVIDGRAGGITAAFEDAGALGMTEDGAAMIGTREGVMRVDLAAGRASLVPVVPAPTGASPWGEVITASGRAFAAAFVEPPHGTTVYAARSDGEDFTALARFGFDEPIAAMVDANVLISRRESAWLRHDLEAGASERYAASKADAEKAELVLSPSRRLALDLASDSFAVLDVGSPQAPPLVPRRDYPTPERGMPAWSPDERRVAFGGEFEIGIVDLESGDEMSLDLGALGVPIGGLERLWSLTWDPKGEAVEFVTPGALWRLDPASQSVTRVAEAPSPGGFTQGTILSWSPDGSQLVAVTRFGAFALEAGDAWRLLNRGGVPPSGGRLAWAQDSSAFAYTAEAASSHEPVGVVVVPVSGGESYQLVASGAGRVLDWLPDGRIVWLSTTGGT
jgi:Tol biopolymer transport system component